MHVVHISDCFLPRLGGIEVEVSELTRRQVVSGMNVTVITATPGHEVRQGREVVNGVNVERVTARLPFEVPIHPRTVHYVEPMLRDLAPDAVHVHLGVVSPFAWGGIRAAVRVGLPTLVTVHSVWGPATRSGYGLADKLIGWSKSGVVPAAVSEMAAERIRMVAGPGVRVLVTPNGVDADQWSSQGRIQVREPDPLVPVRFVAAMRLAPRKRAKALLSMFADACQEVSDRRRMTLRIAGDGPQFHRLQAQIVSSGLADRVELLGRLDRSALRDLYVRADVFIQPSIKESFGLAALEARSTGLPIIARSQTGLTEFVRNEREGLLVDDDAGMTDAIVRLALDDNLRGRITSHNTSTEPDQTWPKVLRMVEEAYEVAKLVHARSGERLR
ncbi:MAG: glycosyltransferase family 4 protein [Candidatus Nanopelagicales bacterium]|nr:glycosyltransferase family 4 protein [Candidatus Nanopelagicales bacterium]